MTLSRRTPTGCPEAGRVVPPVKAVPVVLAPTMRPRTALLVLLAGAFRHWRANEPGVLSGGVPEHVHQMRVALRRMRSALRVFPGRFSRPVAEAVQDDLKRLARMLGDVRDLDVLAARMADGSNVLDPEARERLVGRLDTRRAVLRERLLVRLRSHAHARLVTRLALWLGAAREERPGRGLRRVARRRLDSGHRKVMRGAACLPEMKPSELHAWRLAVKRTRYAAEFFSGLFEAGAARRYVATLARLQDSLGELTDINTAAALLRDVGFGPAGIEALLEAWRPDADVVAARLAATLDECEARAGYWRRD